MGDFMGKMQEMKQKSEEVKSTLDGIKVSAEAEEGKVKVECNGNRKITGLEIESELLADKEQLEELTLIAVNRALEKAEKVYEAEMQSVAKGMLPGFM